MTIQELGSNPSSLQNKGEITGEKGNNVPPLTADKIFRSEEDCVLTEFGVGLQACILRLRTLNDPSERNGMTPGRWREITLELNVLCSKNGIDPAKLGDLAAQFIALEKQREKKFSLKWKIRK